MNVGVDRRFEDRSLSCPPVTWWLLMQLETRNTGRDVWLIQAMAAVKKRPVRRRRNCFRDIGQSGHGVSFAPSCALDDRAGGARQQKQERQRQQFEKHQDKCGVGRIGGAAHVPCQKRRDGEHQEQRHQAHAA